MGNGMICWQSCSTMLAFNRVHTNLVNDMFSLQSILILDKPQKLFTSWHGLLPPTLWGNNVATLETFELTFLVKYIKSY